MRPPRARRSAIGLALALVACGGSGPRPVVLGEDACTYCRMEVTDARFASEAITRTGRVHVFDSVECLAGYARGAGPGSVVALWVTDAEHPGTFVPVEQAGFLTGSSLRGPMGEAVAFASPSAARAAQARLGGTVADWAAVLADSSAHSSAAHGGR
jgi:copper chaperone NosL